MEVVPPHSTLEVNEKGAVYANDVDSSQGSSNHHDDDLRDPDVGKSDAERAALVRHHLPSIASLTHILTPHRTKPWSGRWISG